jgi:hypothetical protein
MVAKITTPHRVKDALNYNENKVQKGQAECLMAANYLQDAKQMSFYRKLAGFQATLSLLSGESPSTRVAAGFRQANVKLQKRFECHVTWLVLLQFALIVQKCQVVHIPQ